MTDREVWSGRSRIANAVEFESLKVAAWILIVQPVGFAVFKLDRFRYALPWTLVGGVLLVIGLKT